MNNLFGDNKDINLWVIINKIKKLETLTQQKTRRNLSCNKIFDKSINGSFNKNSNTDCDDFISQELSAPNPPDYSS